MKKATLSITVIIVVATVAIIAILSTQDKTNSNNHPNGSSVITATTLDFTDQTEVTMDIDDFAYTKPNIKIKKGTKVTWVNQDVTQHNVIKGQGGNEDVQDAPREEEVDPNVLAGPLLNKGESYSFTFNETGSVSYYCSPHPYMKGIVTVTE